MTIGVVGAGSFAAFALRAFVNTGKVRVAAITDIHETAGKQLARRFNAAYLPACEDVIHHQGVNLIYIATPPFLHYEMAQKALMAGKHVICEKPSALNTAEAEQLKTLAGKQGLLYVVNLMQRYNPLYQVVKTMIDEKIAGRFLRGFFENYASDENLDESHWFWKEEKSGGIFIEHGVHFFDMFSGWLGKGRALHAVQLRRENVRTEIYDRVQATLLYPQGIVSFYHGFDQPGILDRQEMRLLFERADITLYEWIPVRMELRGLVTEHQLQRVDDLMKPFSKVVSGQQKPAGKNVRGRFSEISYDLQITRVYQSLLDKPGRYQQMLADLLLDQWKWIQEPGHRRVIDGDNAVESLRMAESLKQMAQKL